jgi:type VI secretion system protein VasD
VVTFAALGLWSGCGGASSRPDCDVSEEAGLTIHATERANPDVDGRPLPTVIRVYQLANIGTIETATFDEMWESDEDTLGDAMLSKDEITVYPDTTTTRSFERNPDANFIVGMAVVRRPTGVSWRSILDMPPPAQEAQCAALQEDPEAEPPEPPTVAVRFEVDDYQIEGAVRFEYPPPPCADDDLICQAERAASDTADGASGEAGGATEGAGEAAPSTEVPTGP